jgi:hypothetical protein
LVAVFAAADFFLAMFMAPLDKVPRIPLRFLPPGYLVRGSRLDQIALTMQWWLPTGQNHLFPVVLRSVMLSGTHSSMFCLLVVALCYSRHFPAMQLPCEFNV